ncbi:hypothetical protein JCM19000A_36680 [Silvimonas sp. JCM 19000]
MGNRYNRALQALAGGATALLLALPAYADTWTNYGGNWSHSGSTHTVDAGLGNKAIQAGTSYQSSTMEADIALGANGDAGFIFHASNLATGTDAYSGYYVGLNTQKNTVVLGRANNNWTQMIAYPYTINPNTAYHLKLVTAGKRIEVFVNNVQVLSAADDTYLNGAAGLRVMGTNATFSNVSITDNGSQTVPTWNFSSVKGAVYTPTNAVNYIEWWQSYDSAIVDRELAYAQIYGINTVAIYLHYLLWENDKAGLLNKLENFLQIANRRGIKVSPIFFDDCWGTNADGSVRQPALGAQGAPVPGIHNSRWVQSPGRAIKNVYPASYKAQIRQYVQDVVNAHLNDNRIIFWEQLNEAGCTGDLPDQSRDLMNDARIAIKDTGTSIPVGSPTVQMSEPTYFSDFFSFHPYGGDYPGPYGSTVLNSESMNRGSQSVPGIVTNYGGRGTGYIMWELGIGRTNTRFPWGSPQGAAEPTTPFHGIVYPDGHPWQVADVVALNGAQANMPVFGVTYFNGNFATQIKTSITPLIDFDLNTERGTASPDASAGVSETNYAIRWTGTLRPTSSETFTVYADSDNIARVWINNVQVINKTSAGRSTSQGSIALSANTNYPVTVEYVHGTGASNMHVTWSSASMSRRALSVIAPAFAPASVRFGASNIAGNFIRHQNSRARIDPNVTPAADSQWRMVPGLADPLAVSFESINYPGQYLRHRNGEVWKDANDGTDLFKADATWRPRVGWADPGNISFESYNYPGNFMRHRDSLLYSEPILNSSSALDKSDATFVIN